MSRIIDDAAWRRKERYSVEAYYYSKVGDVPGAMQAYRRTLALDATALSAANNLADPELRVKEQIQDRGRVHGGGADVLDEVFEHGPPVGLFDPAANPAGH